MPSMLNEVLPAARKPRARRERRDHLAERLQALADHRARLISHKQQNWASITFAGSRHEVDLLFDGDEAVEAGEQFLVAFPDHEFDLPGQLVVDAAITVVEHRLQPARMRVMVEVMLVEQG
jgi:hypothetical protein